jgi:hypothetical protein
MVTFEVILTAAVAALEEMPPTTVVEEETAMAQGGEAVVLEGREVVASQWALKWYLAIPPFQLNWFSIP